MGEPDQFIKQVLETETCAATRERAEFLLAPEIRTDHLTPDGVLALLRGVSSLSDLPAPWNLLEWVAVTDTKMRGDHTHRRALARAELRRHACWARFLDRETRGNSAESASATFFARLRKRAPQSPHPRPEWWQTWLVAPTLPRWLRRKATRAPLKLRRVGVGVYRIQPRDHAVLWIAANRLPLNESLIPFLWARSGTKLAEFVLWLAGRRGVQPVAEMLVLHPMGEQITQKVLHFPTNDEKVRKRAGAIVRIVFDKFPDMEAELRQKAIREGRKEGVKKGVKKGALKTLEHLFTRRLNRPLSPDEHATLAQRIDTHGADRLSDVALDLSAKRLATWLANPDAE